MLFRSRAEMEKQRTRGREARETDTYMGAEETVFHQLPAEMSTEFVGYDNNEFEGKVLALVSGNAVVNTAGEGNDVAVVVDKTPFYAEMGGQIGDTGVIESSGCKIEITDCTKFGGNKFIHTGKVISGEINVGDTVTLKIDTARRKAIARNQDRKSTRLNSSHPTTSRMPSSA